MTATQEAAQKDDENQTVALEAGQRRADSVLADKAPDKQPESADESETGASAPEPKPARARSTRTRQTKSKTDEKAAAMKSGKTKAAKGSAASAKAPAEEAFAEAGPTEDASAGKASAASVSGETALSENPLPEGAPVKKTSGRKASARKTAAAKAKAEAGSASDASAAAAGGSAPNASEASGDSAKAGSEKAKESVSAAEGLSAKTEGAVPAEGKAPVASKRKKSVFRAAALQEEAPSGDAPSESVPFAAEPSADAAEVSPSKDAASSEAPTLADDAGKAASEGGPRAKEPAKEAEREGSKPLSPRWQAQKALRADSRPDSRSDSKKDTATRNGGVLKKGAQGNVPLKQRRPHRQHSSQANRDVAPSVTQEDLAKLKVAELREKAAELEIDATGLKKAELVSAVLEASVRAEGFMEVEGILDILSDGYGFLRTQGYLPSESDCYVGLSLIRRSGLRKGDWIVAQTRPPRENEKYAALRKIISVNGVPMEEGAKRIRFGDLTPVYPDECLVMEHGKSTITARVIDLVSPIGKGQRGLIVSPPKAGKTTILKDIAAAISANNPEVHLMCLLVDERPEEVTDMERSIDGEVISSTFDMPTENHIAVAELVIERAKRLVECGKDVVVLLDSLTRLARAYNLAQPASGRILSGGVDSTALYPPKRFLGAARNIEGGGSLTILASALIDTGSKMDEVIFEEFKGTGNMELKLDRNLADRRIFPAIDPIASGTRKEDLLLNPQAAPLIWGVRRILANMNSTERAVDMLIKSLKQTETNQEFLIRTAKKAQHHGAENPIEL